VEGWGPLRSPWGTKSIIPVHLPPVSDRWGPLRSPWASVYAMPGSMADPCGRPGPVCMQGQRQTFTVALVLIYMWYGKLYGRLVFGPVPRETRPAELHRPNAAVRRPRPVGTRGRCGDGWGPCACPRGSAIRLGSVRQDGHTPTRTSTRPPHPPNPAPCPYRRRPPIPPFGRLALHEPRPPRCVVVIVGAGDGLSGEGTLAVAQVLKYMRVALVLYIPILSRRSDPRPPAPSACYNVL
jgi:hypothetical protein